MIIGLEENFIVFVCKIDRISKGMIPDYLLISDK